MTAFELAGKLKLDSSEFTSSLNQQESSFKSFGNKLGGLAKKAGKVAMAGLATVGAGSVMLIKSSIQEGLDFDAAMSQVAATLGKTTDEIADLSKFARKMGSETAFSATEAAEALNYMALAGYDSETSMAMLPTVLNLAAAGNIDLARASDMVTDAQSALGLSTEETTLLVDKMAKTSSKTNTSVEQLGDAMLTVGGTAKMMKGGTTELSAVLGVLADNGIKGSEGGTALRNVLLSLATPTEDANKALSELGTNIYDAEGNMRDLPSIMADINKATEGMSDKQRANYLSRIFNKRDLKAVEALLGTSAERWAELYGEIDSAEGSASTMAKTMLDNLAGDLKIFNSAVSEAKLSISEKLTPVLRSFVQRATGWVTRLTNAFNEKGLAGAIGEAKTIVKELITESLGLGADATWWDIGKTAASKLIEGFKTKLGEAKVKVANILGLTDENGNAIDDPSDTTWGKVASAAFTKLKDKFKETAGKAKVELANWLGLTDESGNAIDDPSDTSWSSIASKALEKIKTGFKTAIGTAKVKLANILGLTDDSGNAVDDPSDTSWKDIASTALTKIKTGFKDAIGTVKVKLANLLGLTDDAGNAVDDPSDTSWTTIATNVKTKLQEAFKNLKVSLANLLGLSADNVEGEATWEDIGRNIVEKLTTYFSHKGDFLKKLILGDEFTEESTWLDVGKKISGWLEEAFADGGLLNVLLTSGLDKLTGLAEIAGKFVQGIAEWIAKPENVNTLVGIIKSLVNALAQAAGPIVQALITIISDLLTDPGFWASIKDAVISIAKAIWDAIFGGPESPNPEADEAKFAAQVEEDRANADQIKSEQDRLAALHPLTEAEEAALRRYYSTLMDRDENGLIRDSKALDDATWDMMGTFNGKKFEDGFEPYFYWIDKVKKSFLENWNKGERGTELPDDYFNTEVDGNFSAETPGVMQGELDGYGFTAPVEGYFTGVDGNGYVSGGSEDAVPGHNAKGLWDVPYDDYYTRLHRDEMVLSASRARDYREGNYGGGFNFSELVSSVKEAIRSGMEGVSVKSYLNGKDITDEVNRNTVKQLKARRFAT